MIKTSIQSLLGPFQRFLPMSENKGPEVPDVLSGIAQELETQLADADPKMIHLGRQFQEMYSTTEDLTHMIEKTIDIVGTTGENNTLSGIGDFATSSVNRLALFQDRISDSLKILESGMSYLGKLSEMCSNTDKIALLLNVIALNIGIESNRSDRSSEMFKVFVDEVKELSDNIGEVSKTLYDDTRSSLIRHEASRKEIKTHLMRLTGLISSAKEALDKASQTIERLMKSSLSSLEVVSQCSRNISQQVGEIVINMQFHDIIRQKTEHIIQALNYADTRYGQEKHNKHAVRESVNAWLVPALKLQCAQMKSIITEVDDAHGNMLNAFKGIEHNVSKLFSCSVDTFITAKDTDDEGNPFAVVIKTLEKVNSLTSEAFSLKSMVDDTITDAMTSSSDLLKHVDTVQHISLDLQRKALNAIIKAAHLGDMGRAIEVFAQEVTTTSNESNRFADSITRLINAIAETAASLDQKALMEHTDDSQSLSLSEGIENIRACFQAYTENTGRVRECSREIEQAIAHAKEGLLFLEGFSTSMKLLVAHTETMISGLSDLSPGDMVAVEDSSLERYTMESERLVHSQVFGSPGEHEDTDGVKGDESSGEEDMDGTDTVLFTLKEDPEDKDAAEMVLTVDGANEETTPQGPGGTQTPVVDEQDEPEDAKKTNSEKDELGDNIELF